MKPGEQQLRDEIVLREASLADARREFDAGELSEADVTAIEVRERAALERAHASLATLTDASPRRPRRRRKWLLVTGIVCLLLAAVASLWISLSPRQSGSSITGGLSLSKQQKVTVLLREGEADIANGNVIAALSAYQQVLAIDPKNVPRPHSKRGGWIFQRAALTQIPRWCILVSPICARRLLTRRATPPSSLLRHRRGLDAGQSETRESPVRGFLAAETISGATGHRAAVSETA